MTTTIKVAVNGNYKIPVKQGDKVTVVSGRGHEGPNEVTFYPTHGDGSTFEIGPEEPDNGEAEHDGATDVGDAEAEDNDLDDDLV